MPSHLAVVVACSSVLFTAKACTTTAAGSKATADGSVIISHSDDGDVLADPRLTYVPAMDHAEGAKRLVYTTDGPYPRKVSMAFGPGFEPNQYTGPNLTDPIGSIPQVRHTFAYHVANFGVINENNVAFAESTCSAMFYTCGKYDTRHCTPGMDEGVALLNMQTLSELAMERATTAREAIQIMGDLAMEYGFFGTHDANGDGEAAQIGDATEAWTFHILADPTGTSAIWAAVRVPDENVTVLANMFTIREVDVTDTANCMASPNVYSVAEERGWWRPGEILDFTKVYSNGEYERKYYSGRRMWRGLSLMAPSLDLPAHYDNIRYDRMWPWSVKPDHLITPEDIMSVHRDYLQGTEFDLTQGLAAGYGGTPDRFNVQTPDKTVLGGWERSIALYRTNLVHVQHLRQASPDLPKGLAGVAWYAPGPAGHTPFLPIPSGLATSLGPLANYSPKGPRHLHPEDLSWQSLNWAARRVMTVSQVRWDHMHPVVEEHQQAAERRGRHLLSAAGVPGTSAFNKAIAAHAEEVTAKWNNLDRHLLLDFSDNTNIQATWAEPFGRGKRFTTSHIHMLGYPNAWLRDIDLPAHSPPLPPVQTQCPPLCPSAPEHTILTQTSAEILAVKPEASEKNGAWQEVVISALPTCLVALVAFGIGRASRRRVVAEEAPTALYGRF